MNAVSIASSKSIPAEKLGLGRPDLGAPEAEVGDPSSPVL